MSGRQVVIIPGARNGPLSKVFGAIQKQKQGGNSSGRSIVIAGLPKQQGNGGRGNVKAQAKKGNNGQQQRQGNQQQRAKVGRDQKVNQRRQQGNACV